jgi:hypothetical protein
MDRNPWIEGEFAWNQISLKRSGMDRNRISLGRRGLYDCIETACPRRMSFPGTNEKKWDGWMNRNRIPFDKRRMSWRMDG